MIVVVDFDNTITKNTNGIDIREQIPEVRPEIVQHIQDLKNAGHYIKIVTARGCLSCNNDMQKRIAKYYNCVKAVLDHYKIPYDELSFNKEYGEIYLDDSCGNPIMSEFKIFSNPNSRNTVVRYGDMIVKTGPTVEDEWNWYCKNKIFRTSEHISFNPKQKVLYMKYIEPKYFSEYEIAMLFRKVFSVRIENSYLMQDFVGDCLKRSTLKAFQYDSENLRKVWEEFGKVRKIFERTYSEESHGDLTLANMIFDGNEICLIDPVAPKNQYRGIFLDFGKFLFSLDPYFFPETKTLSLDKIWKLMNYKISEGEMQAIRFAAAMCYLRISKYRTSEKDKEMATKKAKEYLSIN